VELDGAGRLISYEEYFPYGGTSYQAVDASIGAAAKRYRHTGKERDEETGLAYHGARYYAGWLGRWTSFDPQMELSISHSPYVGMGNNPITHIDPTGAADLDLGLESVVWNKDGYWKAVSDASGQDLNNLYSDILDIMDDPEAEIVFHLDEIEPDLFKDQVWKAINEIEQGVPLDVILSNAAHEERLAAAEFAMLTNYTNREGESLLTAGNVRFEVAEEAANVADILGEDVRAFRAAETVSGLRKLAKVFRREIAEVLPIVGLPIALYAANSHYSKDEYSLAVLTLVEEIPSPLTVAMGVGHGIADVGSALVEAVPEWWHWYTTPTSTVDFEIARLQLQENDPEAYELYENGLLRYENGQWKSVLYQGVCPECHY
jgi:RHS repeat-associated protein